MCGIDYLQKWGYYCTNIVDVDNVNENVDAKIEYVKFNEESQDQYNDYLSVHTFNVLVCLLYYIVYVIMITKNATARSKMSARIASMLMIEFNEIKRSINIFPYTRCKILH